MGEDKVLIVVPAYNEQDNILKVIKEIKEDLPDYFNLMVINDCSTDKTKEILEKNKIPHLNNIFNMKYAMSVQTGIKYANINNYDFVILMDADGQHIAKEALKLYQQIKKSHEDIIIGSRYLKDFGYPCPKLRRLGTKIFEILINLLCHQKIVDPLSGFQCINKKVIQEYAKKNGYPEYPDANLIISMLFKGFKIKEIPVKMRIRETGISMHAGIKEPLKYMINMIYTILVIVIQNIGKKKINYLK